MATRALLTIARQTHARQRLEFIVGIAAGMMGNKDHMLRLAEMAFFDDEDTLAVVMESILSSGE